ncbi:hypothetical protein J437_LFUL011558 [Ladona fulva]|uniref:Uncharacterized protein n=1 Tax=Ladona fulva TaxID=123851 RepID=A0A8K0KAT9_LADFU|nr:hypothetical protein J437_LFUL011558 [Ladona fulva]
MAGRWSNDCVVAEHRDIQACAMGMDCSGNFALLAGYKCLALISLDDPADVVRSISRPYKDNIKNVQWSPIASCKELCALTNNHKVEILRWRLGEGTACVGELLGDHVSMDGHSRFVTDIDWHRLEPNIIASGAGDGWIHIWDIREHRHPATSFSSIAWVNLICWNRVNEHLLASAHAGDLRLWDRRKHSSPIQYISAHPGEVHDLDWSTVREAELVTCGGQDCSVRFFNVWRPEKPKAFLATASPVWRARHAPFGEGLVTSVSSSNNQKDPSGNNSQLLLWKRCRGRDEGPAENSKAKQPIPSAPTASPARRHSTPAASPVHTFAGHTDIVLDFQWRKNRDEPTNYELVTWSMDQSLRIWRIDPLLQKLCGYEPDVESYTELQECDSAAEISIVNNVHKEVEELSVSLGRRGVWGKEIRKKESAPLTEGEEDERSTSFVGSRSLDSGHLCSSFSTLGPPPNNFVWETKAKELGCQRESASEEVAAEAKAEEFTPCAAVEEASTVLEGTPNVKPEVEAITPNEPPAPVANLGQPTPNIPLPPPLPHLTPPVLESSTPYGGGFQDSFVPFPQTSGARFSSAGFLVCFARPSASRCPWPSTTEVMGNSNGSAFSSASSTCSSTSSYVGASIPSTPAAPSTPTPRSLSALGGASIGTFLGVVPSVAPNTVSSNSIDHHSGSSREVNMLQKSFTRNSHLGHSRSKSSQNMVKSKKNVREKKGGADNSSSSTKGWALVTIYDASKLLFLHRELGEQYIFDTKDLPGMCQTNAMVAASVGRKDLVQVWTLAGLTASCFSTPRQSSAPSSIIPRSLAAAAAAGGWMGITAGLLEDEEEQRIALDEELADSEGEDIP